MYIYVWTHHSTLVPTNLCTYTSARFTLPRYVPTSSPIFLPSYSDDVNDEAPEIMIWSDDLIWDVFHIKSHQRRHIGGGGGSGSSGSVKTRHCTNWYQEPGGSPGLVKMFYFHFRDFQHTFINYTNLQIMTQINNCFSSSFIPSSLKVLVEHRCYAWAQKEWSLPKDWPHGPGHSVSIFKSWVQRPLGYPGVPRALV